MKIALIICGLRYDSQSNFAMGIIEAARHNNSSVTIYTCDAWGYTTTRFNEGEINIFNLINFSDFDGFILHGDTLQNRALASSIAEKIAKAKIPGVSIEKDYSGLLTAGIENMNGISEIVDHLVTVHGLFNINFVSGPSENGDSELRLQSFRETMKSNHLEVKDDQIFVGDYHPSSGEAAVSHWIEESGKNMCNMPQAIICANDEMAIGAANALKEAGYRVPEDVAVTGYDNITSGKVYTPALTTVERPMFELGELAYDMLRNKIQKSGRGDSIFLPGNAIFRESCGCKLGEEASEMQNATVKRKYVNRKMHSITFAEILKSSAAEFTATSQYGKLYEAVRKYVLMAGIKSFYLCVDADGFKEKELSGMPESNVNEESRTTYAKRMKAAVAIRNGEDILLPTFHSKDLLPESCFDKDEDKGRFYVVIPLHFQNICFGYCVVGDSAMSVTSELFHLFVLNISNALQNIYQQNQLSSAIAKLSKLWIYDSLTGVMNRAGFERFSDNVVEEAKLKKKDLMVLFLDLDSLKTVNDSFGHNEGDIFIRSMGEILLKIHRHGELLMRYGGDEFVLLGYGYDDEAANEYMKDIQAAMDKYNELSTRPFTLSASMGYALAGYDSGFLLDDLIKRADENMYIAKMKKKALRNKALERSKKI